MNLKKTKNVLNATKKVFKKIKIKKKTVMAEIRNWDG